MRAAERLFSRRRFHEVKMDDVARLARVGKGTIYRYFESKDDLFMKVLLSGTHELCEAIRRTSAQRIPFPQQVEVVLSDVSRTTMKHRRLFRLVHSGEAPMLSVSPALRAQWCESRRELLDALTSWISRGVAEGHIRADISPEIIATGLLGMLRGVTIHRGLPGQDTIRPIMALFLEGAVNSAAPRRP